MIRAPASPTATANPLPCYCSPLQHAPAQVEEISSPHYRAIDLTVNDPCIYACDIQNVYCKRPSPACSLRRHQSTHCIKHVDPARICTVVVDYYSRNQNQYCTVLILVSPFHSTDRLHLHAVLTKRPQFWMASLDIWRKSLGRSCRTSLREVSTSLSRVFLSCSTELCQLLMFASQAVYMPDHGCIDWS